LWPVLGSQGKSLHTDADLQDHSTEGLFSGAAAYSHCWLKVVTIPTLICRL